MAWFRFRTNPSSIIGAFIVLSVIFLAIFAPLIAPSPQSAGSFVDFINRHSPPSKDFWFGTDNVGRDIFSRVIFGYRVSLGLVIGVLGFAVPFGVFLGLLADILEIDRIRYHAFYRYNVSHTSTCNGTGNNSCAFSKLN